MRIPRHSSVAAQQWQPCDGGSGRRGERRNGRRCKRAQRWRAVNPRTAVGQHHLPGSGENVTRTNLGRRARHAQPKQGGTKARSSWRVQCRCPACPPRHKGRKPRQDPGNSHQGTNAQKCPAALMCGARTIRSRRVLRGRWRALVLPAMISRRKRQSTLQCPRAHQLMMTSGRGDDQLSGSVSGRYRSRAPRTRRLSGRYRSRAPRSRQRGRSHGHLGKLHKFP